MDRRTVRTRSSIINAFLELRSYREIERITVKELCEKAAINKSTFYTHFSDIYALSEYLEKQVADDIISGLEHPECAFSDPDLFTKELLNGFLAHESLIHTLFSGSRSDRLTVQIETSLKEILFSLRPEYRNHTAANILFTFEIYGGFYAFEKCRHFGEADVISLISELNCRIIRMLEERTGQTSDMDRNPI